MSASQKQSTICWVWSCLKPGLGAMLALCLGAIGSALGTVALALLVRQVVDLALAGGSGLTLWLAGLLALTGALVLLNLGLSMLTGNCVDRLSAHLRTRMLAALLTRDQGPLSKLHSGELVNRMMGDVRTVCEKGLTLLPNLLGRLARLGGALAALAILSTRLALLLLAVGVFMAAGAAVFVPGLKKLSHGARSTEGNLRSGLQETLKNRLTVKAFGGERTILQRMNARQEALLGARLRQRRRSLTATGGLSALSELGYVAVLGWGALAVAGGSLSFGTLTAILQLLLQLRGPILGLAGTLPGLASVAASAERLMELEYLPGEAAEQAPKKAEKFTGLRMEHLNFSYEDRPVLRDFSGVIQPGDCVALLGSSGVGKTTLLQLLLGFYAPESGRILLDTQAGELQCGASTRRFFAYVPQENGLLSGSIRENLLLARPDASEDALWQALALAEADFVKDLPGGLDAGLQESGGGLSQGQNQRIAIARALLSPAPILLLDEATAALDSDTERRVLEHIRATGRTILAVTHHRAAVQDWRILSISEGEQAI